MTSKVYRLHSGTTEIVVPLEHLRRIFLDFTEIHRSDLGIDENLWWESFLDILTREDEIQNWINV